MTDKLAKIQDQAETAIDGQMDAARARAAEQELLVMLGGIKAVSALTDNLHSARIMAMRQIRDEKRFLAAGFTRFAEFMDECPFSPMSYDRFNEFDKAIRTVGASEFDVLRGSGLSMRQMRRLKEGDVVVDGGVVRIGDEESVELGDDRKIRSLVEQLISDRQAEKAERERSEKAAEKMKQQLEQGQREFDRLARENDDLRSSEGSRISRAMMAALHAFFNLIEAVGELPDDERAKRKADDLKIFVGQFFRLQDAYGTNGGYIPLTRPDDREMDSIDRALAAMDMEDLD